MQINFRNRYDRQVQLSEVGPEGQELLRKASVLIVGLGGLGCPAALYLAGAGVGRLGLLDHDRVEVTNLHRQPLYGEEDLGKFKADVAARKLNLLNSEVRLEAINRVLDLDHAEYLMGPYDIVLDGTDNFESKYLINDACLLTGKPWVYGAVYRYQGQVSVFNYQGGPTYRCLFPTPGESGLNCEETGVLGVLPGLVGTMQAAEVLKMILSTGRVLSGQLKVVDMLSGEDRLWAFEKDEDAVRSRENQGIQPVLARCELRQTEKLYLDVREAYEQPGTTGAEVLHIPLRELSERWGEIPRDREVLVFCQTGGRSDRAVEFLRDEFGFDNVRSMKGGIHAVVHESERR